MKDSIPAETTNRERQHIMKSQVKRLRRSPDTSKMFGFRTLTMRAEYYFNDVKKRDRNMKHFAGAVEINPKN